MTATAAHLDPSVRHDMVFLFDVTDGNPNGDPDAGNRPRIDEESGHGLVTDVALKRKLRDTLALAGQGDPRMDLFVQAGTALNTRLEEAYSKQGATPDKAKQPPADQVEAARAWLTNRYVDIRLFGAVLSSGKTPALGQIRGPLQVTMARSIDPVVPVDHTITRVTQTKQEDTDKGETTEIGGKWTVPYGLYRAELYYSAVRGQQTGVTADDLAALYRSLEMMFDHDRSATRGRLTPRGLYVFSHSSAFGEAPAHKLTGRVTAHKSAGRTDQDTPRAFSDYTVALSHDGLPDGVTATTMFN